MSGRECLAIESFVHPTWHVPGFGANFSMSLALGEGTHFIEETGNSDEM